MIQPLFCRCAGGISNTDVVLSFWGANAAASTTNFGQTIISAPCVLSNIRFGFNVAADAGTSYTFTLQVNSVDSALTIVLTDAASFATNIATQITLAAGDVLRWRISVSGAPGPVTLGTVYAEFNTDDNKTCIYPAGNQTYNSVEPRWSNPFGINVNSSTAAFNMTATLPCDGTITGYYGHIEGSGTTGTGFDYVLYLNGVVQDGGGGTVDTRLSLSTTSSPVSGNVSFSLPVVEGDQVYCEITRNGSASSRTGSLCFTFVADVRNKIPISGVGSNLGTGTGAVYPAVVDADGLIIGPGELRTTLLRALTFSKLYVNITAAPGPTESRIFTVLKGGVDQALAVTIADPDVAGNAAVNVEFAANDAISLKTVCASGGTVAANCNFTLLFSLSNHKGAGGGNSGNKKGGGGAINLIQAGGANVINYNPGIDIGITG